ncbi:MAG TPA: hypothetical protein VFU94_11715 [Conexibacter sp.]|nr:hypothetical protein [Conexibacter sp.]
MTREERDGSAGDGHGPAEGDWTPAERALLEAALEFYDAAQGVIDYAGSERPRLRHDAAGFEAVRQAMATLEQRVLAAHAAGATPERIAEVARMDAEMVELILRRPGAASSPATD